MRVGVYVHAFDLFAAGRTLCGTGTPGWRWLDPHALAAALVPVTWRGARIDRLVHCTAPISEAVNPSAAAAQAAYLEALAASGFVDAIELAPDAKSCAINVAAHLLIDVLSAHVDAAIVISNDGDLRVPVQAARARVPVGIVNPGAADTDDALEGCPDVGAGGHWWTTLTEADYRDHQLPVVVGSAIRPVGW